MGMRIELLGGHMLSTCQEPLVGHGNGLHHHGGQLLYAVPVILRCTAWTSQGGKHDRKAEGKLTAAAEAGRAGQTAACT